MFLLVLPISTAWLIYSVASPTYAAILNTHPSANAAYSLRKLDSAYAGSAIRVRRDFDDTEQDIGFNGSGNLDTTALQSFVPAGDPTQTGNWKFLSGINSGTLAGGMTDRTELSGLAALLKSGNEGYFVGAHDSNTGRIFVFNKYGENKGDIILTGATMTDAEEVSVYTTGGVSKIVVGAFGDNAANRATKQLFRFTEPTITGSNITIPNDGSWEQINFQYPATPLWEDGSNLGDAEAMFIDAVGDNKIYIISKRETVNKIFSLPLQSSYTGTQTMTYEGEVHANVAEETGGIISPANAVAAAISQDGLHVLIKTYKKIYQFTRTSTSTSIATLLATAPVEVPYVGLGAHPSAEPQGESVAFDKTDSGYYTISEQGTGSASTTFPFFYFRKVPTYATTSVVVREGLNSYAGTQDTYVNQGANEGTNYGAATSMISDKNVSDERFSMLKWTGLDALVPAGARILTATMAFDVNTEGQGFDVHKIIGKTWNENTVTWTNLGGMNLNDIDASSQKVARWSGFDTYTGAITLDLDPAVVQDWVDNPSNNNGLWIIGTHPDDGQQLTTSEGVTGTARPQLTITYYTRGTGYVTKWYDQSGNANDLTQTTNSLQPKIVTGGSTVTRNSLPAVFFDGTTHLQKTSIADVFGTIGQQFIVSNFDSLADTSQAIFDISTSTTATNSWGNLFFGSGGLTGNAAISGGGVDPTASSTFADTTVNIYNQLIGNTHRLRVDQSEIDTNAITLTASTASNLRLGQLFGTTTFGLIGTIQEAVFYDADKTSSQVALEANMLDYWIAATPPSTPDLNATNAGVGAVNSTATVANDVNVSLSTDVLAPTDADIDTIKLTISGLADGSAEKIIIDGSTVESLNTDFTRSNITAGGVSGINYTYTNSSNILLITKNSGGVFTGSEIEAIIEAISYKNTQASATTDGARVFTFKYLDSMANQSAGTATATITVTRAAAASAAVASAIIPGQIVQKSVSVQVPNIIVPNTNINPQNNNPACPIFTQNFHIGQSGPEVKRIQLFLKGQGLFAHSSITEYYGPVTESAVKAFQVKYKTRILTPGGYSNPTGNWYAMTRFVANELSGCSIDARIESNNIIVSNPALSAVPNTAENNQPDTCPIFAMNLKFGDRGREVERVQQWLFEKGFMMAAANGYFGPATKRAVMNFQEAYKSEILLPAGLNVATGNWYAATRNKANSLMCQR